MYCSERFCYLLHDILNWLRLERGIFFFFLRKGHFEVSRRQEWSQWDQLEDYSSSLDETWWRLRPKWKGWRWWETVRSWIHFEGIMNRNLTEWMWVRREAEKSRGNLSLLAWGNSWSCHNLGGKDGRGNRFRDQEQEFSWGSVKFEMFSKYPNGDVK